MSFGKRTALPPMKSSPLAPVSAVMTRRGGYPLAVLTVAVVSYLSALLMVLIPYFNPTGLSVAEVVGVPFIAVLNVAFIAALILWLVDMALRRLRVSSTLVYAVIGGGSTFLVCVALSVAVRGAPSVHFTALMAMMVLIPTTVGGSVLGLFRRSV